MKQHFIRIYDSWKEDTSALTDQEKGRLIDLLIDFLMTEKVKQPEGNERFIYPLYVQRIKREIETHNRKKGV